MIEEKLTIEYTVKLKNTSLTGLDRFHAEKEYIHKKRNVLKKCPYCNSAIQDRKASLHKQLIDALYRVYCWCGKNRKHEFHTKDIKHLLGKTEYNRFGDLVRMGGIIYRPKVEGKSKKAFYGIHMGRAKEFFNGQRDIPIQITLDQITGEILGEVRGKIGEFPDIQAFLTKEGLYDHEIPIQDVLL